MWNGKGLVSESFDGYWNDRLNDGGGRISPEGNRRVLKYSSLQGNPNEKTEILARVLIEKINCKNARFPNGPCCH